MEEEKKSQKKRPDKKVSKKFHVLQNVHAKRTLHNFRGTFFPGYFFRVPFIIYDLVNDYILLLTWWEISIDSLRRLFFQVLFPVIFSQSL